jgi:hypothetical protein
MSKSRLTTGVYVLTATGLLATWAYSQNPSPLKNPSSKSAAQFVAPDSTASASTDDLFLLNPDARPKQAKSSRIMFEANWKNVQVGAKPMHFHQADKACVWTVKNTGDNPVEVGNDYGFSIPPGEEDFIVDTRLSLSVTGEKTTTVEVKASRVMTQGELTQEAQPTMAPIQTTVPGAPYIPGAGIPTYNPNQGPTYAPPTDQFAPPSNPKGGRKPSSSTDSPAL